MAAASDSDSEAVPPREGAAFEHDDGESEIRWTSLGPEPGPRGWTRASFAASSRGGGAWTGECVFVPREAVTPETAREASAAAARLRACDSITSDYYRKPLVYAAARDRRGALPDERPRLDLPSVEALVAAAAAAAGSKPGAADEFADEVLREDVAPRRELALRVRTLHRAGLPGRVMHAELATGGPRLDLALQDLLQSLVLRDEVCEEHPPDRAAQADFLRPLVRDLERDGREVHERLLEAAFEAQRRQAAAMRAVLAHDTMAARCHRAYEFFGRDQPPVVVRLLPDIFNNVGLTMWPAGLLLAEWAAARGPALLDGRRVLELGSGVGLTAAVVARAARPASLVATDYDDETLRLCRANLELAAGGGEACRVAELDWTRPSAAVFEDASADVVLAADCVYDPNMVPAFVATLAAALRAREGAVAYVASRRRNPETFALFESELAGAGLARDDLPTTEEAVPRVLPAAVYDREGIHLFRVRFIISPAPTCAGAPRT